MATKYVSQTTANGYAVGSDANDGSTKALAKLTLEAAITAATAADTIVMNDGTYTAATYFDVAKALTINSETDYGTTIKCTGAVGQVIRVGAAGVEIKLGKMIIDAESNAAASCVGLYGTTARTVTLNGTRLRNPGAGRFGVESISSGQVIALNISSVDFSCTSTAGAVQALLGAGAHVDINGLTVDNSASSGAASNTRCPVYLNAGAAATHRIRGVSGTWKTAAGAISSSFVRTSGTRGIIERNRGMNLTGGDTSGCLIRCENSSGVQADSLVIRKNQGVNATTGGFLILVGADGASANDNKTNYSMIFGNDVAGTDAATLMHGIMIGNSKGGVICGNKIYNAGIPVISKLCSEAVYQIDNDIVLPHTGTSGCLRAKGCTNTQMAGNRIILASGSTNAMVVIDRDPTVPTLSLTCSAIANTLYSPVDVPRAVSVGGAADASTATFVLNNYNALSYTAGAFVYQAATYNTAALWGAANETTYLTTTPIDSDLTFWKTSYEPVLEQTLAKQTPWLLSY